MRNRFTTRNQWFTETIETIRTSGLTLIISTIRFFKTYTAEFGLKGVGKWPDSPSSPMKFTKTTMEKLSKMPPGTVSSHGVGLPKRLRNICPKAKKSWSKANSSTATIQTKMEIKNMSPKSKLTTSTCSAEMPKWLVSLLCSGRAASAALPF